MARTEPGCARGRRVHAPRAACRSGQPRHGRKRWRLHHSATRPVSGVQRSHLACRTAARRGLMSWSPHGLRSPPLRAWRSSAYDDFRRLERIAVDLEPLIPCVIPGSTIVQANLAHVHFGTAARGDPLANEAGKVAAATGGLDLVSADLAVDQWIQRYSGDKSPQRHLVDQARLARGPPPLDFDRFERATGESVDYVILFGRRQMSSRDARVGRAGSALIDRFGIGTASSRARRSDGGSSGSSRNSLLAAPRPRYAWDRPRSARP